MGYGNKNNPLIKIDNTEIREALENTNLEISQALVNAGGEEFNTLKEMLDDKDFKIDVLSSVGINIESFPRITPEANDNGRFMRAHDSLVDGGKLFIPNQIYTVNSLTFTKTINIVGSFGILKLADGTTSSDYILSLKGDYSTIEGVWFDGNKANTASNTGRAEGLRLEGNYCTVHRCISRDTLDNGYGHTFVNMGKYNVFDTCVSYNAGYAAFANVSGDYLTIRKCQAFNFRIKGFKHNGNANLVVLDDFYGETNTTDPAADGILFDSGEGNTLAVAKVIKCTVKGTVGSNSLKCEFVDSVIIENSELLGTGSTYGINFQESVKEVVMKDVKLNGYMRVMEKNNQLVMKNVRIISDSSKTENIDYRGKELIVDGLYLEGAQNGIRLEALHASGIQTVTIDNIELNATTSTSKMFRSISFLGADHITLKKYKITNGDTSIFSGLTGVSANDKQIQRSPRIFYHNNIPTTGIYKAGDIIYKPTPTISGDAGSKVVLHGWRRLTDGSTHVLNTDWVEMRMPIGI
ncbi:hypothetical protein [Priestia filamentosa]|uniref:hypothetical protein n=1 Tax=Priestia filamentosa TaxID=1402861 RepID=UPI000A0863FC|nr:hypothetical protein [Priestia filamentosa]MDT3762958.1 hypothetical protein [Priestia filamentosa]OXS69480.1 hypothetical protein B1B01_10960 [Priestia filamentosa]WRU97399.1 hypothetical protein RYX51_10115 [Priestia filamentosa]SMF33095.1 hypothetical protein SAMN06296056_102764 [Priestia filamentosa]